VAQPALQEQIAVLDTVSDMDPEEKQLLTSMLGSLEDVMSTMGQLGDGDSGAVAANSPFAEPDITVEEITVSNFAPESSWEITFPQSLQWALIGVAAAFAIGIVVERRSGTFLRLRLAPISRFQILAGKGLACFTAAITASVVLLAIGILVFGVRVASWPMLAIAVGSSAFCFVGIMMFMSVLGKTEQAVAGAGWAILLVMSMTGGGMVPLMAMPSWMFKLGSFSAVKWSILSLEGAIWRGFGPSEMLLPVGVLLGMGVLGLTVGTIILSKSD
jgi:ABC-2 type transport system permease protein